MREYQILSGRTRPNMTMSQSGGYILSGVKLDPKTGRDELDERPLERTQSADWWKEGTQK